MTADIFKPELAEALKAYDRYIVCIHKTPDEFETTVTSLITKAIGSYQTRAPGFRHGIALDKFVTVILSQTDDERPLCGIYFNLNSPYQKPLAAKIASDAAQKPQPRKVGKTSH